MKFTEELPRILVVDDKQQNRLLITTYLETLDVIMEEAASGSECLNLLEKNSYSLIILDVQMPGMDGFEVLEKMRSRKETADIPVVLISAIFDSEQYIIKGIESGAIDYIVKPVNITILCRKVSNFLNLYEKQKKLDRLVQELEITNARLKENEKKLKKITDSANDAIILLNSNYRIRFWNKTSKKYFGYSKYEIIYEDFFEKLIAPRSQESLREYFNALFEEDSLSQISTIRLSGKKKPGTEFPIELSLAYFHTVNNEINYTVIIRDITRRLKMEKDALKAKELHEANKLMKEFIDSVSHELRTPMNAILGISNMLLKYNADNLTKKQFEGLEIINQSGSRLLDMINDVLDLSRIDSQKEQVKNERFNLDEFLASLHSIILSLIDTKKIKFYIRKSTGLPEYIVADAKKLNQILTNILGNSVKFTHKGSIHLYIHEIENKLYFEITDTGIGIAKKHLTSIFDKFKQIDNSIAKEYKGTGLGLNISKKLIEMMGGEIKAESQINVGTTMKFYIPLADHGNLEKKTGKKKEIKKAKSFQTIEIKDLSSPLAIVIDNNTENLFLYTNVLNSKGFEALSFDNTKEGLKSVLRYLPDLIILKYEMPGIHGHTFIQEINKEKELCEIPVLLITSGNNIKQKGLNKNSRIVSEPTKEDQFSKFISNTKVKRKDLPVRDRLIFYEKENNLKKWITKKDKCFQNESCERSKVILARRKIRNLFLDGIDLKGENFRLLKWIQQNNKYLPENLIVVLPDRPFDIISEEIAKTPNCHSLELQKLSDQDSFETAVKELVSSGAKESETKLSAK